jgi:hypothetical protein
MFEQKPVQPFNFDMAYDHFSKLCNKANFWEQQRIETIKSLGQNK